jgi:hypothetical protein
MTNLAIDYVNLTRICEFARRLHKLHRVGDDEAIDREFSARAAPPHGAGMVRKRGGRDPERSAFRSYHPKT